MRNTVKSPSAKALNKRKTSKPAPTSVEQPIIKKWYEPFLPAVITEQNLFKPNNSVFPAEGRNHNEINGDGNTAIAGNGNIVSNSSVVLLELISMIKEKDNFIDRLLKKGGAA